MLASRRWRSQVVAATKVHRSRCDLHELFRKAKQASEEADRIIKIDAEAAHGESLPTVRSAVVDHPLEFEIRWER